MLVVRPGQSKTWVCRTMVSGVRKDVVLGTYPAMSLHEAREIRSRHRAMVKNTGQATNVNMLYNPAVASAVIQGEVRQQLTSILSAMGLELPQAAAEKTTPTLAEAIDAKIAVESPNWTTPKTQTSWRQELNKHVSELMGRQVHTITVPDITAILLPLWNRKHPLAKRLKQRLQSVFALCKVQGHITLNPVENVEAGLGKGRNGKQGEPASLDWRELPAMMQRIATYDGHPAARDCLMFAILTAARSGEATGADWSEFNLETRTWTIPAERMKSRKVHSQVIPAQAVEILERQPTRNGLVFPSVLGLVMDGQRLTEVLRRLGDKNRVHGMRESFRSWTAANGFNAYASRAYMAHDVADDGVDKHYNRGDGLEERQREVAEAWGNYCFSA